MFRQSLNHRRLFALGSGFTAFVWLAVFFVGIVSLPFLLRDVNSQQRVSAPGRVLSFDERVAYQRAIEEVYWRHMLWPKENTRRKPSLDEALPLAATRARVENALRMSNALERQWGRSLDGEALQREIERMAERSRQPEVLRELWAALDNDPFVIAEMLARPILVEQFARDAHAFDQNIHARLREHAAAQLKGRESFAELKETDGVYSLSEAVRVDEKERAPAPPERATGDGASATQTYRLSEAEWDAERARLREAFDAGAEDEATAGGGGALPVGRVSKLQEDEDRFYVVAVVESTERSLKTASVEWRKTGFDAWWTMAREQFDPQPAQSVNTYRLARISEPDSCAEGTWRAMSALPDATGTAVWTGAEMIVWGGNHFNRGATYNNSGSRYRPATDSWTAMSSFNAPQTRRTHSAVWSGTEMIIWGGYNGALNGGSLNDGGRYNPQTDTWQAVNRRDAPQGPLGVSVWTGTEMIVWGKNPGCISGCESKGNRYDPALDEWRPINLVNAPVTSSETYYKQVWTGTEMIVWGQNDEVHNATNLPGAGGRYNPLTDSWTRTSQIGAPVARINHVVVWTGSEMLVWGGSVYKAIPDTATGGRYNPSNDTWQPMTNSGAPIGRQAARAVWTGAEMVIWGGVSRDFGYQDTGSRYNPSNDTWTPTSRDGAPSGRLDFTAIWTGGEMIVWGGRDTNGVYLNTGAHYNPATDAWRPTGASGVPAGRYYHSAVWTGELMIVWGGTIIVNTNQSSQTETGGRYDPQTLSWTATELIRAPHKRINQVAHWTGTEMIIWGGYVNGGSNKRGAIYCGPQPAVPNNPPSVSVISPTEGTLLQAGASLTIEVEASDSDGTIASVSFYAGNTLLGTDNAAPYSFIWNGARSGSYALTAAAADDAGDVTRSAPVNITVEPVIGPPNAFLTSPTDLSTFEAPATIRVAADVQPNPDRDITKVEFYLGDGQGGTQTLVHTDTTAPYGFDLTNQGAGTYSIYAFAHDGVDVGISPGARFNVTAGRFNHALASRGATATASSRYDDRFPAEAAIDGNRRALYMADGRFNIWASAAGAAKPDWLEVNFGAAKSIDEINVLTQQDDFANPVEPTEQTTFTQYGATSFDVRHWDGVSWVTIPGGSVTGNDKVWRKFTFPAVTTTKVRVVVHGAVDGHARIMEVEAWTE